MTQWFMPDPRRPCVPPPTQWERPWRIKGLEKEGKHHGVLPPPEPMQQVLGCGWVQTRPAGEGGGDGAVGALLQPWGPFSGLLGSLESTASSGLHHPALQRHRAQNHYLCDPKPTLSGPQTWHEFKPRLLHLLVLGSWARLCCFRSHSFLISKTGCSSLLHKAFEQLYP